MPCAGACAAAWRSNPSLRPSWLARIDTVLQDATLSRPRDTRPIHYGKRGQHGEALGYLVTEMQALHRPHPGARW